MARKRSELAARIGLTRTAIEETLQAEVLEAAEIVAEEFRRILVQLNENSIDKPFTGYSVTKVVTSKTRNYKSLGTIDVPQVQIYVEASEAHKSMEPPLNVFDILDEGRKGLPERGADQSPYPLWALREPTLVGTPGEGRRRAPSGRFTLSLPPRTFKGSRPEKLRQVLIGPKSSEATYSPAIFTQGPIAPVPARNLYERVYSIAKRKLKSKGFKDFSLIIVGREQEE